MNAPERAVELLRDIAYELKRIADAMPKRRPRPKPPEGMQLYDLNLGGRAINSLRREGVLSVSDLLECTETEVSNMPGIGKLTYKQIKDALAEEKLSLIKGEE